MSLQLVSQLSDASNRFVDCANLVIVFFLYFSSSPYPIDTVVLFENVNEFVFIYTLYYLVFRAKR